LNFDGMKGRLADEIDIISQQIRGLEAKIGKINEIMVALDTVFSGEAEDKVVKAPVNGSKRLRSHEVEAEKEMEKKKRTYADKKYGWENIREVLKQMYPQMLTVDEIATLGGMPRTIVSYHTSHMRRLLRREYVRSGPRLHWMFKMTLKYSPIVDGEKIDAKVADAPCM
jgi:hypothetical protein